MEEAKKKGRKNKALLGQAEWQNVKAVALTESLKACGVEYARPVGWYEEDPAGFRRGSGYYYQAAFSGNLTWQYLGRSITKARTMIESGFHLEPTKRNLAWARSPR